MSNFRAQVALRALLLLTAALLAACGGDDDDDDAGEPAATQQPAATAEPTSTADNSGNGSSGSASDGFDFGQGLAVVTIGDERFEFDLTEGFTVCRDVFGGIQFGGQGPDGTTSISGWIPPANWESFDDNRYDPPSIEVENDATNSQWLADEEGAEFRGYAPGTSQVDSFEIDGLRASGSATFIDSFAIGESDPVEGTFQIACAE